MDEEVFFRTITNNDLFNLILYNPAMTYSGFLYFFVYFLGWVFFKITLDDQNNLRILLEPIKLTRDSRISAIFRKKFMHKLKIFNFKCLSCTCDRP